MEDFEIGSLARPPDDVDFSDITGTPTAPAEWLEGNVLRIHFPQPLTAEQRARVRARLEASNPNEEQIRAAARSLFTDLRTIRDSTGTLSTAALSNAVRVLAKGEIALAKLVLRDLQTPE